MRRSALWWAASIYLHRWLGIAGGILFVAWFVSGIAMMYVRMPALTNEERLMRAASLDLSAVRLTPAEAARRAGLTEYSAIQVSMLAGRPVYRFRGAPTRTVFADTGDTFTGLSRDGALDVARAFAPEHAATTVYDGLVEQPDQWTLQSRSYLPVHRVAFGDAADTRLYLSNLTGEAVMKTTRRERLWANVGPVTHWLYWPWLRRDGALWSQVIIWTSAVGCAMCILGLVVGLWRYSPSARFRLRGVAARTPYAGWLKWHHYAGLIFGAVTLTWTFSGLLSMGPFAPLSSGELTRHQREAVSGGPVDVADVTIEGLRAAVVEIGRALPPKELSVVMFRGEPFWIAERAPEGGRPDRWSSVGVLRRPRLESRLVRAVNPDGARPRFSDREIEEVARAVMPGTPLVDATWLTEYDAYYYDRRASRPLPVLRVRYDDDEGTWLYFDPHRGSIAMLSRPRGRVNRWLYNGLHSFDFPRFHASRPAWDITLIALSAGGVALSATTLMPGWHRLRRHARRLWPPPANRERG